jgi:hypothetical protein
MRIAMFGDINLAALESLDQLSLQRQLDAIGQTRREAQLK